MLRRKEVGCCPRGQTGLDESIVEVVGTVCTATELEGFDDRR
jgi:hypothetical protein